MRGPFPRFNRFREEHAFDAAQLSLFEYMAYMLFFVHILCGSNLTVREFMHISDRSIYRRNGWRDSERDPNSSASAKLYAVGQVLATAAVFLTGRALCRFERLFDPEFQRTTPLWRLLLVVPLSSSLQK